MRLWRKLDVDHEASADQRPRVEAKGVRRHEPRFQILLARALRQTGKPQRLLPAGHQVRGQGVAEVEDGEVVVVGHA